MFNENDTPEKQALDPLRYESIVFSNQAGALIFIDELRRRVLTGKAQLISVGKRSKEIPVTGGVSLTLTLQVELPKPDEHVDQEKEKEAETLAHQYGFTDPARKAFNPMDGFKALNDEIRFHNATAQRLQVAKEIEATIGCVFDTDSVDVMCHDGTCYKIPSTSGGIDGIKASTQAVNPMVIELLGLCTWYEDLSDKSNPEIGMWRCTRHAAESVVSRLSFNVSEDELNEAVRLSDERMSEHLKRCPELARRFDSLKCTAPKPYETAVVVPVGYPTNKVLEQQVGKRLKSAFLTSDSAGMILKFGDEGDQLIPKHLQGKSTTEFMMEVENEIRKMWAQINNPANQDFSMGLEQLADSVHEAVASFNEKHGE